MRVHLIKHGHTLVPAGSTDKDKLRKVWNGEVIADIKTYRNLKHHRKFFAILRMAAASWREHGIWNEDTLLDALKLECGYVKIIKKMDGTVYYIPKSISFAMCDQDEFEKFYRRVLDVLAAYFKCRPDEIENNSLEHYQ